MPKMSANSGFNEAREAMALLVAASYVDPDARRGMKWGSRRFIAPQTEKLSPEMVVTMGINEI